MNIFGPCTLCTWKLLVVSFFISFFLLILSLWKRSLVVYLVFTDQFAQLCFDSFISSQVMCTMRSGRVHGSFLPSGKFYLSPSYASFVHFGRPLKTQCGETWYLACFLFFFSFLHICFTFHLSKDVKGLLVNFLKPGMNVDDLVWCRADLSMYSRHKRFSSRHTYVVKSSLYFRPLVLKTLQHI